MNADGYATGNDGADSTQELGEGDLLDLGFEVPDRVFQRGLRHAVAADLPEDIRATSSAFNIRIEQTGAEFVLDHEPGRVDRLVAEVGVFAGDALAPCGEAFRLELYKKYAAARGQAEAGLKWMGQRHVDLAHVNGIDVEHVQFLSF